MYTMDTPLLQAVCLAAHGTLSASATGAVPTAPCSACWVSIPRWPRACTAVVADVEGRTPHALLLAAVSREQLANQRRLLIVQNLRTRQPVAKDVVPVELPEDLLVARYLGD